MKEKYSNLELVGSFVEMADRTTNKLKTINNIYGLPGRQWYEYAYEDELGEYIIKHFLLTNKLSFTSNFKDTTIGNPCTRDFTLHLPQEKMTIEGIDYCQEDSEEDELGGGCMRIDKETITDIKEIMNFLYKVYSKLPHFGNYNIGNILKSG